MNKKVLVAGSDGFIGSYLVHPVWGKIFGCGHWQLCEFSNVQAL